MGGTFNPIHFGHLLLAECARETVQMDEVWFVPTGYSYMKAEKGLDQKKMPTPQERLALTELALQAHPQFRCLDIEVRREGNTYTCETLRELHAQHPEHDYFFIVGADCLFTIEHWRAPEQIFAQCTLVAAVRGDADIDSMQAKIDDLRGRFQAQIQLLPFRRIELSSTEIRERVGTGRSIRYMAPAPVIERIEQKGFYRT